MSEETPSTPDLNSLEIDLAQSFLPSWAKGSEVSERLARLADKAGDGERRERPRGRSGPGRDSRGPRSDRGPSRGPGGQGGERRPEQGGGPNWRPRNDRRDSGRGKPGDRRFDRESRPAPAPVLTGWNVQFLPEPHGVEGVARQMKADFKAYPLFDLAWLVLEKPDRYRVEFRRAAENAPALFQLKADGSVWLGEREALAHVLSRHLEKYYRRERVTVDPPKGAFPFVAVCGMSGKVLGPPNYHDYQLKILKLHAERYSNMPFEVYKGRIRMERDEALIQKWKDEQSSKDEFYPLETPEGTEPLKLATLAEVEEHFRANHMPAVLVAIREKAVVPGPVALEYSAPLAVQLVRQALEEQRRFPLALANTLGRQLTSKGLQIFKAHQKITYVALARPRYLDRETVPVADGVKGILEYLEAHAKTPRVEQLKALVALRTAGSAATEAECEAAMATDLLWLLREGHVIDFARKGLEVARKPQPAQPPKSKKAKEPKAEAPAAAVPAGETAPEPAAGGEANPPVVEDPEVTAQVAEEMPAFQDTEAEAVVEEPVAPPTDEEQV